MAFELPYCQKPEGLPPGQAPPACEKPRIHRPVGTVTRRVAWKPQ